MADPTYQETVTSNIPDWAKPYALKLLGRAEAITEPVYDPETGLYKPRFTPYKGDLVAGLSPLQEQAMLDLAGMQVSPQTLQASGLAGLVGQRAGETSRYEAMSPADYYKAPTAKEVDIGYSEVQAPRGTDYQMAGPERVSPREYGQLSMGPAERVGLDALQQYRMGAPERLAGPTGPERVSGTQLQQYQMGPAQQIGAERFGLGAMQEYMSPYMQGVVEQQKRAATQDYMRQLPGMGAAAARAGAKGGTRESLLQAEAQRGLQERLGDIEATGLQQAYQQAASQFGQDRAAQMQAAMANQQAGLTTGQQNLAAQLQTQGLSSQQAMEIARLNQQGQLSTEQLRAEIAKANQAAGMTAEQANQQAALQVQQLGTQTGMQAALANQQAGMQVGQQNLAAEQARQQFLGQQGMQAQLANQAAQQQAAQQNLQAQIQQAQFAAQQAMQAGQTNQATQLQAQAQRLQQQQALNQFNQQNAQLGAQYGLAGAQLGEQSRQFGAGLGMQGLAQQLAAAQALGGLGQQQFQQQTGITSAQLGAGAQAQALAQQRLAAQYQQFMEEQQAPYKQLEFMSGILRGTPATAGTTNFYQQPPSTLGMIAGLTGGIGGLFGNLGG